MGMLADCMATKAGQQFVLPGLYSKQLPAIPDKLLNFLLIFGGYQGKATLTFGAQHGEGG